MKGISKPRRRTPAFSTTKIFTYQWKILDWYWARKLFAYRLPSVNTTGYSSSSWSSTSRRRWSDWILETERWSSEQIWALSTLVWRNVEEYNGKRRRKQEEISMLCWSIRTRILYLRAVQNHSGRNFIDPSSQDNVLITFHHKFRIDTGKTKFEQKTNNILYVCGSYEQGTQRSEYHWPGSTTSCMVQAEKVDNTSIFCVLGRHQTCSKERI